ncbi:Immune inhibitor A peptidase M6 [Seminavis robusta]|uniref:Immune inhibitor A peptidase M6 n=1 Tax=Seminavis robusta TaxID=568900 RepID=A0A9N8DB06_9STRA|nr:Immune inhibitor A peptidase M6 [Seminavis robusta]|eukprot:Sro16_g011480.1 Immune inhibitor A peptidase M6 (802) ;mRNA; f:7031-9627
MIPPLFPLLKRVLPLLAACHHFQYYGPVQVEAWIPPPPHKRDEWESVRAMRSRLGLAFNYTPRLLHEETCRFLTEEACRNADEGMIEHASSLRALSNIFQHKQVQASNVRPEGFNPNKGVIRVLVLLVRFTDHQERPLVPKEEIEAFWNERAARWFEVNSHGVYKVEAVVTDWLDTDNTELHYNLDGKRGIDIKFQQALWPVLDALDQDPSWDWAPFDQDKNGKIDSVVCMHSGYGSETQETDEFDTPWEDRIWAHAFTTSGNDPWLSKRDGLDLKLWGYTVASSFEDSEGVVPAKIGLTAHEYMHTFGLPDLYETGEDAFLGNGIGGFDIMGDPYGPNGDADLPGHLNAYSTFLAGWGTPKLIEYDGVFTLQPLEVADDSYKIVINSFGSKEEYLLLENRQQLEFDKFLYGSGLGIYHIDDFAKEQDTRGYPGQEGWPENNQHYACAMLQADGNYNLEKGENKGDAGDLWQPGQVLGPGRGNTVFPNTDAYADGFIAESGVVITVLEGEGQNVRFEVSGLGSDPNIDVTSAVVDIGGNATGAPAENNASTTAPNITVPAINTTAPATAAPNTTVPTMSPAGDPSATTMSPSGMMPANMTTNATSTANPTMGPSSGNNVSISDMPNATVDTGNATTAMPTTGADTGRNATTLPPNATCGSEVCDAADEYCYKDAEANITQCIPTFYDCGARECPNNPNSYCDIDSGTCKLFIWVCEGVNTEQQKCDDKTAWKRWTLSGDSSSVSTATICGIEDSVCNPEAGGGGGGESAAVSNNPSFAHALLSVGTLAAASAYLWFQPFSF